MYFLLCKAIVIKIFDIFYNINANNFIFVYLNPYFMYLNCLQSFCGTFFDIMYDMNTFEGEKEKMFSTVGV